MYACRRLFGSLSSGHGLSYTRPFMQGLMRLSSAGSKAQFESSRIRKIKAEEVEEVWMLEAHSFPGLDIPAENLPIERFIRAQREAPELFWGHFANGKMTGFVLGTLGNGSKWTYDSMFKHDPKGAVAFLHLLCVYPEYRKMGIGKALLSHLKMHIEENFKGVTKMCFICEKHLIPVYERMVGFTYTGASDVTELGNCQWYDMEYRVPASPKDTA